MSLAHLRETKAQRNRSSAAAPRKVPAGPAALCGASREPAYRTLGEAEESGLAICGTCVALFRRQGKVH
jgi:hypothetical protein